MGRFSCFCFFSTFPVGGRRVPWGLLVLFCDASGLCFLFSAVMHSACGLHFKVHAEERASGCAGGR